MRYMIERVKLDKLHPLWPEQEFYGILDTQTGRMSLGLYTTYDAAQEMLNIKKSRQ